MALPSARRRWRKFVLLVLAGTLAACATPQARKPAPAKSQPAPTPSASKPPAPVAAGLNNEPGYQQDKERLRLALARNAGDSLAPNEVGYYMDVLQGRLRQIGNSQFGLAQEGGRIVVTLIGSNAGGVPIEPSLSSQLMTLAKVLAEYRKTVISVQAEATGDEVKARRCTLQAARALTSGGVTAQRIAAVGAAPAPSVPANGDFSGCSAVVVQLEPVARTD